MGVYDRPRLFWNLLPPLCCHPLVSTATCHCVSDTDGLKRRMFSNALPPPPTTSHHLPPSPTSSRLLRFFLNIDSRGKTQSIINSWKKKVSKQDITILLDINKNLLWTLKESPSPSQPLKYRSLTPSAREPINFSESTQSMKIQPNGEISIDY